MSDKLYDEDTLRARTEELEDIIKADNERLIRAGLTVGLYSGCDTAEIMAEVILASRDRIIELETERDEARAMVERLVEAAGGYFFGEEPPPATWRKKLSALVAEWKEMEK